MLDDNGSVMPRKAMASETAKEAWARILNDGGVYLLPEETDYRIAAALAEHLAGLCEAEKATDTLGAIPVRMYNTGIDECVAVLMKFSKECRE